MMLAGYCRLVLLQVCYMKEMEGCTTGKVCCKMELLVLLWLACCTMLMVYCKMWMVYCMMVMPEHYKTLEPLSWLVGYISWWVICMKALHMPVDYKQ